MSAAAPMVYAATIGAGGLGLIVVAALIIAAIVIFVAMSGSLKRLRQSVDKGVFDQPEDGAAAQSQPPAQGSDDGAVTRDQAGPGGAAV